MRKLGAVNEANYYNYMERKLWAWYRRFPPKQAAADSAADVAAEISAPAEA
jgi:acyl-CoA thioesterase FadM